MIDPSTLPALTASEMAAVDEAAVARGLSLLQMMENAGCLLARLVHERVPAGMPIAVLAGPGGNGGGALAAARRLAGFGHRVLVIPAKAPDAFTTAAMHQWRLLEQIEGIELLDKARPESGIPACGLIVDGLLGYSLRGAPLGAFAQWIEAANAQPAPVVSLDLPSGLDPDSGITAGAAIRAEATLTLALPKKGLFANAAQPFVGRLALGDIGIAPSWIAAAVFRIVAGDWYAGGDLQWLAK
ncbi:MAG: NAD(P)H-hydrate epimerase [Wenzhouxiangellaceae bacterium]|nr:NAD(P)H-hydrate epimerase [Wenzhouxiangellaceae bacterium]